MASSVDEVPVIAPVIALDHADMTRTAAPEHPQTKRNRIQLSCAHCRHAKLKCDREKPCSQCVKKGRASVCTFAAPVTYKRRAVSMQNRLKHLESLVKGVMTSPPSDGTNSSASIAHKSSPDVVSQLQNPTEIRRTFVEAPIHTKDGVSNSSGQVVLRPNETTYVGATHWAAMLDDVRFRCFCSPDIVRVIVL
jgi:Fungal Zn(2)-Cys(6) binuclear cluster domain